MMDPRFCGEIKIVIMDENGDEQPLGRGTAATIDFTKELEIEEEKTFTQKIADIITEYEQMLVDWDTYKVSEEKMLKDVEAFQLKSRPMMLDMLDEFKTINNILGYLRTMISSARIASMYGVEVSDDLKDIIDEVDFLRDKIKFNKEEPVIGRSAGVDEIEEFLSEKEEIEILDLEIDCDCDNCCGCDCKEEKPKATIEELVNYLVMDYEARMDNYSRSSSERFMRGEKIDELYDMMKSDKEHAQIIATRLKNYIRCYVKDELHLIEKLNKILK